MPSFDAGSIEGTLTLDRTPFTEGLKLARKQAEDFSKTRITPTISIDTTGSMAQLQALSSQMQQLNQSSISVTANAHTQAAMTQLANLQAMMTLLNGQTATLHTNVNNSGLPPGGVPGGLPGGAGSAGASGGGGAASGGAGGLAGLPGLGALLGPAGLAALSAFVVPLTGELLGLVSALSVAGVGLGGFALVAIPAFKNMTTAVSDLKKAQDDLANATSDEEVVDAMNRIADAQAKLEGPMGDAALAMQSMKDAYKQLQKATEGPVFGVMAQAFTIIADLLPKLQPLIEATAGGLSQSLGLISDALASPEFQEFLDFVTTHIGPVLGSLTTILINFAGGFGSLVENTTPLMLIVLHQLVDFSKKFGDFVNSPTFQKFVDLAIKSIPPMTDALGSLAGAFVGILLALAPLQGPVFDFLKEVGDQLQILVDNGTIDLLAEAFGQIIEALIPLLPIFATLATQLMPAFVEVISALAPYIPGMVLGFLAVAAVAFLVANPIIALVVIIGGLIGIVVLLINHWDKVQVALGAVGDWFVWLWGVIWDGITGALRAVGDWFAAWPDNIKGALAGAAGWLVNIGSDIIGGLWNGIQSFWGTVWSFFANIASSIAGAIGDIAAWTYNKGYSAIVGIWNGMMGFFGTVLNWFVNLPATLYSAVGDIYGWFLNIGNNIVVGIWNGIVGMGSWLYNKVSEWAKNNIPAPVRWALSIFSPSRVMADIGKNVVLGLAGGIISNGNLAVDAMRSMADDLMAVDMNGPTYTFGGVSGSMDNGGSGFRFSGGDAQPDPATLLGDVVAEAIDQIGGSIVLSMTPDGKQVLASVVKETNDTNESRRG